MWVLRSVAGVTLAAAIVFSVSQRPWEPAASQAQASLNKSYGKLPIAFEENRGQTDARVDFLARGSGYTMFLTPTESVLSLSAPDGRVSVLRTQLVGARSDARATGLARLPGRANYFLGNDPAKWVTGVPTFGRVQYSRVYPGVDLVYYGRQGLLEYDLVVGRGADPGAIKLRFAGARDVELDGNGDLVLRANGGNVRLKKPTLYQEVDGVRHEVVGGYALEGRQAGFRIGAYDATKPLVIDPVIVYSTYLGGSGTDEGRTIAVDSTGNAYLAGYTISSDFPAPSGAYDTTPNGGNDAFVSKLNPAGTALVFSTYLGGSASEEANGGAVDSGGNVYVGGVTRSVDFPMMNELDNTLGGLADVFMTKFAPAGDTLLYSTYFGGTTCALCDASIDGVDTASDLALDSAGRAYVTGTTTSDDYPDTPGAFQATKGNAAGEDAHVAVFDPSQSGALSLVAATYLGGNDLDRASSIAVDSAGNAYITGRTDSYSSTFPTTPTAYQSDNQAVSSLIDGFLTKLAFSGSASTLAYSTYLGGGSYDEGTEVAVGTPSIAYVTGQTGSTNFPVSAGALDGTLGGADDGPPDAFVTKIDAAASGAASLLYSTYLGGTGSDFPNGIALFSGGDVAVTGRTSGDFPVTGSATQSTYGGGVSDVFVSRLSPVASGPLSFSTYLGGIGEDQGLNIALGTGDSIYLTGFTTGSFPTTAGAYDTSANGGRDAFVTKISPGAATAVALRSFTARRSARGVALRWRTGSELGLAGFNVFRERSGRQVRLNRALIPATGGAGGDRYVYRDARPAAAQPLYRLQGVRADGSRIWLGSALYVR